MQVEAHPHLKHTASLLRVSAHSLTPVSHPHPTTSLDGGWWAASGRRTCRTSSSQRAPMYQSTPVPGYHPPPPAHPSPKVTQPHVTQEVILEIMYRPLAPVNSPCTPPCNMRGLSLAGPGALLETARSSSTMSRPTRRPVYRNLTPLHHRLLVSHSRFASNITNKHPSLARTPHARQWQRGSTRLRLPLYLED